MNGAGSRRLCGAARPAPTPREAVRRTRSAASGAGSRPRGRDDAAPGRGAGPVDARTIPASRWTVLRVPPRRGRRLRGGVAAGDDRRPDRRRPVRHGPSPGDEGTRSKGQGAMPIRGEGSAAHRAEPCAEDPQQLGLSALYLACDRAGPKSPASLSAIEDSPVRPVTGHGCTPSSTMRTTNTTPMDMPARGRPRGRHPDLGRPPGPPVGRWTDARAPACARPSGARRTRTELPAASDRGAPWSTH